MVKLQIHYQNSQSNIYLQYALLWRSVYTSPSYHLLIYLNVKNVLLLKPNFPSPLSSPYCYAYLVLLLTCISSLWILLSAEYCTHLIHPAQCTPLSIPPFLCPTPRPLFLASCCLIGGLYLLSYHPKYHAHWWALSCHSPYPIHLALAIFWGKLNSVCLLSPEIQTHLIHSAPQIVTDYSILPHPLSVSHPPSLYLTPSPHPPLHVMSPTPCCLLGEVFFRFCLVSLLYYVHLRCSIQGYIFFRKC